MDFNPEQTEENEDKWLFASRDGLVLLVDCSQKMYQEEKFAETIEIIESMIRNLIIKNEKNLIGVLFYNVQNSPPPFGDEEATGTVVADNIAIFLTLKSVCADSIKFIRKYRDQIHEFPVVYGHCDTNPNCLNDAFWLAAKMLRNCGYKLKESRILVFTDNPSPFQHGSTEERNAFKRAEDLRDTGITVTVVPMSESFSGEQFYSQFIATVFDTDVSEVEGDLENPSQLREHLLRRTFQKDFSRRCNSHIKFNFGQGLEMSVGIYSMYREAIPPKKVLMNRKDNEVVQAKRIPTIAPKNPEMPVNNNDEASIVMPGEIKKFQEFRSDPMSDATTEKVVFSMEEYTKIKRVMSPGVTLLGFKPKSTLVRSAHLRAPNFMYPDESILKGSTTLFRALWEKCLERQVVAYAILVERNLANPKLVVLVPQEEVTGKYERYNGFRIEYIPYADCIREIEAMDEKFNQEITRESIDWFKKVIHALRFRYSPAKFHNPVVRGRYDLIEATVLEEPLPEMNDLTLPDDVKQDEVLNDLIEQFNDLFEEDSLIIKRKADGTSSRPAKAAKTYDPSEIESAYNDKNLGQFTIPILKDYLTKNNVTGLSKLKKKEDYVAKVEEVIENNLLSSVSLP